MSNSRAWLIVVLALVGMPVPSFAQSPVLTEEVKLHGDGGGVGPGAPHDRFGRSVAFNDDTALVGAPGNSYAVNGAGLVTVFVQQAGDWVEQQTLSAADSGQAQAFGCAVALNGDTAVVGACRDNQLGILAGAAYVFVRAGGTWTQQQKLVAADGAPSDHFGSSVAVSGDLALVGSPWDGDAGEYSGSAYLFVRSGGLWSQQQKLTAADAAPADRFGISVALEEGTALVGADHDDDAAASSGSVYEFVEDGGLWVEQQKLAAADATSFSYFGRSVALEGDTALVGAVRGGGTVADSGSAYLFVRSGGIWSQMEELNASDGAAGDMFGGAVALEGEQAVVGASRDDTAGAASGSAYVFGRSGGVWSELAKLTAADAAEYDTFGTSVALSGGVVLVGAPGEDEAGQDAGAAYSFVSATGGWSQEQKLMGAANAAGNLFGLSAAISKDTLLVGAPGDGWAPFDGSVFVFARSAGSWVLQQTLSAGDPGSNATFGWWIALSGDVGVVGAPDDSQAGFSAGAAHVFVRVGGTWTEQQKLLASDAQAGDTFGRVVALSGETVLVTAADTDDTGSVYLFGRDGGVWVEQQKLTAPVPAERDRFGYPSAVEGNVALIGSTGDDEAGIDAGAVYVFERLGGTWVQTQKLLASDADPGDGFGFVALSGDTALVGAGGDDESDVDTGAVYVFERDGGVWLERQKLLASEPQPGGRFGSVVSMSDDRVVAAEPHGSCVTALSGVAYLFEHRDGAWSERYRLCASDGTPSQWFGLIGLVLSADTMAVGAPADEDDGWRSGSVYVFGIPVFADGFETGDTSAWSG